MRQAIAIQLALRELRGGLAGFYVFITCIALGVMAISGVGSVASSLAEGIAREGRVILGGDLSFNLTGREITQQEQSFLEEFGQVSAAATMRAMARTGDGRMALVELKAVDRAYPLYGSALLEPASPLGEALSARDGAFGAAVDPALMVRLDLTVGDHITIGSASLQIRAVLKSEPDKLAGGIGFGPRVLVGDDALRATALVRPGSLVRWHYRLKLADNAASDAGVRRVLDRAATRFPEAGWEVRTRSNASPSLEQNVERFSQYLTLVGLTALLIGGVGVANAVKGHLDRKRGVIATLKSLGATGGGVFTIYLVEVAILALIGALPGLLVGGALPFLVVWAFGGILPLPLAPAVHPGDLALALLYGLLTALAFALWPLGRAHDVSVSALFRDEVAPERHFPRMIYTVATALAACLLATLAIKLAYEQRIAAIFVASAAGVFVMLRLVAALVMLLARRVPRPRSTALRLAIANIHRPGSLTVSVVLSLGLGLALLVTILEIDSNLRRQFMAALPDKAPSFFFLDIQAADAERFDAFIHEQAPHAVLERVPMLRGRIMAANGVPADELKPPPSAAWVLQSDRGITFSDAAPAGSRVTEGEWWPPDYAGPPLVSFEKKIADALKLKLGDPVTVNVLGRNLTARIANLRTLDWQSLGINFVMVFSPNTFRGAPVTHIATLTYPGGGTVEEETALIKAAAEAFPSVTAVRVRDAIDALAAIVSNFVLAVRGASGLTLLIAVLVLGGALAAGHRHRVYDAVILRTVGATRGRLILAYALEYLMIGLATALFAVTAGSLAAAMVITQVMNLPFVWAPLPAIGAAAAAVAAMVVLGLIGTFTVLGQKPAPVLRAL